jgi:hypothetical protein
MSRVDSETSIAGAGLRRVARAAAAATIITGLLPFASAASPGGPTITFFGPVNPQSVPLTCPGVTQDGVPICNLDAPTNFLFVIEGRPGPSAAAVGTSTFNASGLPDLQIQTDRALGNGSPAVCDAGGVAPISPPDLTFSNPGPVNDFACRFETDICTRRAGQPARLVPTSTVQFCAMIDPVLAFANGDTRVSLRLRDVEGGLTETRQLVLRAGASVPTRTATVRATPTQTPGGLISLAALIRAIFNDPQSTAADVNEDDRVSAADIPALFEALTAAN